VNKRFTQFISQSISQPRLDTVTNVVVFGGGCYCLVAAAHAGYTAEAIVAAAICGVQAAKFVGWLRQKLIDRENACDACGGDHTDELDCDEQDCADFTENGYDSGEWSPPSRYLNVDDRGFPDVDGFGAPPAEPVEDADPTKTQDPGDDTK